MFARPRGGPTVLRILLGAELRRLREARNISREEAGYAIRASDSKISRMELGRVGFKERDVTDLLSLYGVVDEQERAALTSLARQAMRAQLEYLIEATSMSNVTVQIVPFQRGGHAAAGGPFSILRFAEPDLPDIVYLEQLTSALYLERREDVDRYLAVMERLCLDAEPTSSTTKILHRVLTDL